MSLACGVSGTLDSAAPPAVPSASCSPGAALSAAAKGKLLQASPQVRQRWIWEPGGSFHEGATIVHDLES